MHEDYVCKVLGAHRRDAGLKAVAVIIIVINGGTLQNVRGKGRFLVSALARIREACHTHRPL